MPPIGKHAWFSKKLCHVLSMKVDTFPVSPILIPVEWCMCTWSYKPLIGKHARLSKKLCHMPSMWVDDTFPSFSSYSPFPPSTSFSLPSSVPCLTFHALTVTIPPKSASKPVCNGTMSMITHNHAVLINNGMYKFHTTVFCCHCWYYCRPSSV